MNKAKEYLKQIGRITKEIERIDLEIERNRLLLMPGALRYDKDRVQTSPEDKLAAVSVEIETLRVEQVKRRAELARVKYRIITEVSALPKLEHSELLYLRYVNLLSLDEIAERMGYDPSHIRHMHGWALDEFERRIMRQ